MFKPLLKDQKGSAMLMAVMGMAVISIFTITAIFIGTSNARQTQREGKKTQAYYVADTGAKSLIKHLENTKPEDLKTKLDGLTSKGKVPGTYRDKNFDIEVIKGEEENQYEIISTGDVDDVKDGTRAILSLQEKGGGGYEMGDGKIFINDTDQTTIPKLIQLQDAGLSMYTKGKRSLNGESSIFISEDRNEVGPVKELFYGIDNRNVGNKVKDLNNQRKGKYGLEIIETINGKAKGDTIISSNNLIKKEILKKYKSSDIGSKPDPDFNEIELNYELQKEEVIKYFSYEKLPDPSLKGTELDNAIEKIFMLPINDKKAYEDYLKGNELFPLGKYSKPHAPEIKKGALKLNKSKESLDFRGKDIILIDGEIELQNSSELTIQASKGADIYINGGISTSDSSSSKMNKMIIETDGKINFHIKEGVDFNGELIVKEGGDRANFYVYGDKFQINNNTIVKNIDLYAPKTDIQLGNNITYEGVIVAKKLEFNDTAKFKAPSKGSSSSSMNKELQLGPIEWKEWQEQKEHK